FGQMIVSRDGATLAMIKDRTSADNDIYLKGVATDETPRKITAHEGNISQALFDFTPGGDKLIFGTDEHGEFAEAWSYEVSTGEKAPYLKADWDIMYLSFSPTGRYRVH